MSAGCPAGGETLTIAAGVCQGRWSTWGTVLTVAPASPARAVRNPGGGGRELHRVADHHPFTRRAFLPDPGSDSFSVWDRLREAVKLAEWRERKWQDGTLYIAGVLVEVNSLMRVRRAGASPQHDEMTVPPASIARRARLARTIRLIR